MDDFMVVRPERAGDAAAQAQRAAIRGALAAEVNRRLAELDESGGGLGVEVVRADVTALLPPSAKPAFDAVLDAAQTAEQGLAAARTDAARTAQAADRDRDRVLAEAHAAAEEEIGAARGRVAAVLALAQRMDAASRPNLLDQLYRERIAGILKSAGSVTTVDPADSNRLILSGAQP
jgi:regulator of protease activity HflC (stomatin/prohibitin superfamily)